ncbi:hypothetical protein HNY73_001217 [Argiope bruennichi]|uniref:Uncharacterized protein n=1 Tax=Argiope bruennichi TaxID=94029 RepID=A0A8T0G1W9_ARGBR|nr:hypothetical protein HNY73_001217 [Argiope bruennichi]
MIPAAIANEAAEDARHIIVSSTVLLQQRYKESTTYLLQRYKPKVAFTLWKIYKIKKSLLINALGALVTYGVLMGTIGRDETLRFIGCEETLERLHS